ncbi:MAG: hypothetical protein K2P80_02845 [Beijerinckiaceae bacterium]|nr:hypothetical protein [Beijerinckiaceae bacterium]
MKRTFPNRIPFPSFKNAEPVAREVIDTGSPTSIKAGEPEPRPPLDRDLGSCGRAGRQHLAAVPATATPIEHHAGSDRDPAKRLETDLFGRPVNRRHQALVEGLAARKQAWVAWPVIGAGLDLPDGRAFDWTPHSSAFHSGATVSVYAALSDGCASLGKYGRLALSKLGISTRPDLVSRMVEANVDRYASLCESDGHIIDDPGFDSWEPLRLPPMQGVAYPSPVERLPRSLLVSLPSSMTVAAFDQAFTAMLHSCRLDSWIDTPDGEHHCARHDIDPRRLRRFTAHVNADGAIRLKQSCELYIFRRDVDTDRLVAAIEGLIARHLSMSGFNKATQNTSANSVNIGQPA